jgi:hypothetical protein
MGTAIIDLNLILASAPAGSTVIVIQAPEHWQRRAPATLDYIHRVCESACWRRLGDDTDDDAIERFREFVYRQADESGAPWLSAPWMRAAFDAAAAAVP